jgi:hypothetical protein
MGLDDLLKGVAQNIGSSLKDLAEKKGNELVTEWKGKLASEVEELKAKATAAVTEKVSEQVDRLKAKASAAVEDVATKMKQPKPAPARTSAAAKPAATAPKKSGAKKPAAAKKPKKTAAARKKKTKK